MHVSSKMIALCLLLVTLTLAGCGNPWFDAIVPQKVNPWEKLELTIPLKIGMQNIKFSASGPLAEYFNPETVTFSWTPGPEDAGDHELVITATDGSKSVTQKVKITVSDPIELKFDIKQTPTQADFPDASAVILRRIVSIDNTLTVQGKQMQATEVAEMVKVFSREGIEKYGEVRFTVNPSVQQVFLVEAKTIRPNGEVIEVKENAVHIVTPPSLTDANIYSDIKQVVFSMPSMEEGSVVAYRYLILEPGSNDSLYHHQRMQATDPIKYTKLEIAMPEKVTINHKTFNADLMPTTDYDKTKRTNTYTWIAEEVSPVVVEVGMPSTLDVMSSVMVSTYKEWSEVSKWYTKLLEKKYDSTPAIDAQVTKLTEGLTEKEDQIKAIFNWVATNIRYVAVSYNMGAVEPNKAGVVLENKYGDCKDKSTLLISMLNKIDVKAEPVLIDTTSNPDMSIVTPAHFDHMIVYLEEFDIYLDPTSSVHPYGSMPYQNAGKNVFLPVSGLIKVTPSTVAADNKEVLNEYIQLQADGSASIRTEMINYGAHDAAMKSDLRNRTAVQQNSILRGVFDDAYAQAAVDTFQYELSGIDGLDEHGRVVFTATVDAYADIMGNSLLFRPLRFPINESVYIISESRRYPLYMGYPDQYVRTTEIKLPVGYVIDSMPQNVAISEAFGSLTVTYEQVDEGTLKAVFNLLVSEPVIEVEQYAAFRSMIRQAQQVLRNQFIVKRN